MKMLFSLHLFCDLIAQVIVTLAATTPSVVGMVMTVKARKRPSKELFCSPLMLQSSSGKHKKRRFRTYCEM
jgi:hypothetical protein